MESITYQRQEDLKLTIPESVAVVGCGGVGSWTAYLLALAGVKELWLFDHDVVSENNLNRIPVGKSTINMLKTEAVAKLIESVRPDCQVLAMKGFTLELASQLKLGMHIGWIIATTDTHSSRIMIHKWAADNLVSYIEGAAEGEFGSTTSQPAEWTTPEEEQPGYASVPVWVGPCILAATLVTSHVIHNTLSPEPGYRLGWENGFRAMTPDDTVQTYSGVDLTTPENQSEPVEED